MQRNHRRYAAFKVPNNFILDSNLTYSAKRVGCVLYSRCNCLGACRMSIKQLAELAQCSSTTALKAVQDLEHFGYITRDKILAYSAEKGKVVYQKSKFTVSPGGRFTFIPRNIFCFAMKNSSFTIYLFLRLCAGNYTRAFPSLNRICNDLYASKSTVCEALKELSEVGLICAKNCRKRNRAYSSNSYYFVQNVAPKALRKTCSMISALRKAKLRKPLNRIPMIRIRWHADQKLFYTLIIQKSRQKINTGG